MMLYRILYWKVYIFVSLTMLTVDLNILGQTFDSAVFQMGNDQTIFVYQLVYVYLYLLCPNKIVYKWFLLQLWVFIDNNYVTCRNVL